MEYQDLTKLLFLDIETVCCSQSYENLGDRLRSLWDKKAYYLNPDLTSSDLFFERGAIYAEFGKIVAIGCGFFFKNDEDQLAFKVKCFSGHDECSLLSEFKEVLLKFNQDKLVLCAHNGKEFDYPYLCRRMLVNQISLPACLKLSGKKPWEIRHLDTLEMWKFGDRKNFTSLELLAALFDIPGSKQEMDGSRVSEVYYKEKDLNKIARYCCEDVVVTAQLFLRMHQMPVLSKENIIYS